MAGIKALSKVQLGRESSAGTAVAATTIWRGPAAYIDDMRETIFADENVGILTQTDRTYVQKLYAEVQFPETEATFEQFPHVLEAGIMTATPAADGIGTDKIYTYNIPETAQATRKAYTIETGDDQQAEEQEYSFVKEFNLFGVAGGPWKTTSTWGGRQASLCTFTGALSVPAVDEMLFSKTTLAINADSDSYGDTAKSNTLLEANLRYMTGVIPVFTADGSLYFSFTKNTRPDITLSIIFEHDATSVAEKAAWRAETARLLQLKCTGPAVATPGTTYTYKTMIINLAGKWEKFDKLGERDGNDIVSGTFRAGYNATKADIGSIIVVNELASLP